MVFSAGPACLLHWLAGLSTSGPEGMSPESEAWKRGSCWRAQRPPPGPRELGICLEPQQGAARVEGSRPSWQHPWAGSLGTPRAALAARLPVAPSSDLRRAVDSSLKRQEPTWETWRGACRQTSPRTTVPATCAPTPPRSQSPLRSLPAPARSSCGLPSPAAGRQSRWRVEPSGQCSPVVSCGVRSAVGRGVWGGREVQALVPPLSLAWSPLSQAARAPWVSRMAPVRRATGCVPTVHQAERAGPA